MPSALLYWFHGHTLQCEEVGEFKPLISNMAVVGGCNEDYLGFTSNEIRREEAERLYWREVMKDVQP